MITNNQKFLKLFRHHIISIAKMNPNYVPFTFRWVAKAYSQFPSSLQSILTYKQIKSFLKQLALHAPNRQVQQPEDALRHYMLFPEKISILSLLLDQDTGPLWESVN
jgi:hypothetical protein